MSRSTTALPPSEQAEMAAAAARLMSAIADVGPEVPTLELPPSADELEARPPGAGAIAARESRAALVPAKAADERTPVKPLRRRNQRVRRRKAPLLLRLLKPLALAVGLVGAPVAAALWLLSSPRFALREMSITTGDRVSETWVRETLAPFAGRNLLRLELASITALVGAHPWVAGVDLRKEPPAHLRVEIRERRAAALLRRPDGLVYLDERGRPIAPFEPGQGPADLVLVTGDGARADPSAALELHREIEAFAPPWLAGLSEIEILGEKDFRLFSSDLPFALLVRAGGLAAKARRLEELLPGIVARHGPIREVDLRFDRRIIVQPDADGARARRLDKEPQPSE